MRVGRVTIARDQRRHDRHRNESSRGDHRDRGRSVGTPVDQPLTGLTPIETVGGVFGDVAVDSSGVPTGEDLVLFDGPILANIALPGAPDTPFPEFYFDFPLFTGFLFVDSCADDGSLPGCPAGVGGTVLAPFDGGLDSLGDFRLGTRLGSAPRSEDCFAYTDRQPARASIPSTCGPATRPRTTSGSTPTRSTTPAGWTSSASATPTRNIPSSCAGRKMPWKVDSQPALGPVPVLSSPSMPMTRTTSWRS